MDKIFVVYCGVCKGLTDHIMTPEVAKCEACDCYYDWKLKKYIPFCGFCRGECKGEHYVSPSTEGY